MKGYYMLELAIPFEGSIIKEKIYFEISRKCCKIAAISHDSRTPAYSNLEKIRKKEIREILEDLSGDSRH